MGELLKREVADIIRRDVDLSGMNFVSVTAVTVSRDLRNATVFFTRLGCDDDRDDLAGALNEMKGFIRKQLASRVRLKRLPDLVFRFDDSIGRGMRINQLIDSVNSKKPRN